MDGVYEKGSHLHGSFVSERHDKYDQKGRDRATHWLRCMGYNVTNNDVTQDGKTDFTKTDLVGERNGEFLYVEAAVKSSKLWGFIGETVDEGVDIETRKLKYVKEGATAFVFMSKSTGTEMFLIPMKALQLAQNACGDNFKGHDGAHGKVKSSDAFVMPEHGCHRVRKWCIDDQTNRWTLEDFYRIPYKYVSHIKFDDKEYTVFKKREPLPI